MHFDADLLAAMTTDQLEDVLNWVRFREKDYRRNGEFALGAFWAAIGRDVIVAMSDAWQRERDDEWLQLRLEASPREQGERPESAS